MGIDRKGSVMIGGLLILFGSLSVGCLVVALFEQSREVRRLRGVCWDLMARNVELKNRKGM